MTPIWMNPDRGIGLGPIHILPKTAEILLEICKKQRFTIYEDAVIWLIEKWQQCGESRDFAWEFNHCNRPKFWFGDRVKHERKVGHIYGMQWKQDEMLSTGEIRGWSYQIRWQGSHDLCEVEESLLTKVE